MKKLMTQIAAIVGIIVLACLIARAVMGNVYTIYLPVHDEEAKLGEIRFLEDDEISLPPQDVNNPVLSIERAEIKNGRFQATFRAMREGEAFYEVTDQNGKVLTQLIFRVGAFHTIIFENTLGFTGDLIVIAGLCAICLAAAFLMIRFFIKSKGSLLFSYDVLYVIGFSFFVLSIGIMMFYLLVLRAFQPVRFFTYSAYSIIAFSGFVFIMVTCPLILIFAVLLAVSNIELLRHERKRLANVLGILISVILVAGEGIAWYLSHKTVSGSLLEFRIYTVVINVYAITFVYFECMLFGAILCGLRAVWQKPAKDKDFIIILGCGFRKDGSLTPLLKGRVDRAVRFLREQSEETGKTAVLIPSGGQGENEVMPEAEAMSRYLESECGVPDSMILKEDQSKNTYQNMAFSKKIIEENSGKDTEPKVLFVTTNYHIFRSGVWATLAGLKTEGTGCKTKWWFWPNAFIRECIGLLLNRIKVEVLQLLVLIAFFAVLSFFTI